ncbi:carboxylesterase/lipase family protein [Streptomyces cyanogenus]|uniref:Carboxylic ester hydrolase n=1 Tax=Streptomyces cyanogenus TaxID=80860 RepID=A0ABX7TP61_STRCY|nr:carboxylesterase family protein [Streptomyces cyanogenus]QTD96659.1 Carboxylesterase [Streptomyces cyanogenus]
MHHHAQVTTAQGTVRGMQHEGVHAFRAIPYAAPLVGASRFAAPQPPRPWSGVREAAAGPTAPAPPPGSRVNGLDLTALTGGGWIEGPEYLTLNVWTPEPAGAGLPVMLFVHGGGFLAGTAQAPLYDGTAFARSGVVLVTCNYRLGAPGWLHLPGRPDNRGTLDVIAALSWIQDNIAAFGGDPRNVTVFGQSAGATLTATVLAQATAPALLRRAISQSGNAMGAFTTEQATRVTHAVARHLGVRPTIEDFADIPDVRLVSAVTGIAGLDLTTEEHPDPLLGLTPLAPVLTAGTLEQQPAEAVESGAAAGIDLLVGTNTDEAALYLAPTGALAATSEQDLLALAARIHPQPHSLLHAYQAQHPQASAARLRTVIMTDHLFATGSRRLAHAHARHPDSRTYSYEFSWRSAAFDGSLGACHCIELPFVFNRTDLPSLSGPQALLGPGPAPLEEAAAVHAAWVRFASTGDLDGHDSDGSPHALRIEPLAATPVAP